MFRTLLALIAICLAAYAVYRLSQDHLKEVEKIRNVPSKCTKETCMNSGSVEKCLHVREMSRLASRLVSNESN